MGHIFVCASFYTKPLRLYGTRRRKCQLLALVTLFSCCHGFGQTSLLLPLNVCRKQNFYLPWECEHERHVYERYIYHCPIERALIILSVDANMKSEFTCILLHFSNAENRKVTFVG